MLIMLFLLLPGVLSSSSAFCIPPRLTLPHKTHSVSSPTCSAKTWGSVKSGVKKDLIFLDGFGWISSFRITHPPESHDSLFRCHAPLRASYQNRLHELSIPVAFRERPAQDSTPLSLSVTCIQMDKVSHFLSYNVDNALFNGCFLYSESMEGNVGFVSFAWVFTLLHWWQHRTYKYTDVKLTTGPFVLKLNSSFGGSATSHHWPSNTNMMASVLAFRRPCLKGSIAHIFLTIAS